MAAAAASVREPKSRLGRYFVLAFSFTWACWWLAMLEARDIIELPAGGVPRRLRPGSTRAWSDTGREVKTT